MTILMVKSEKHYSAGVLDAIIMTRRGMRAEDTTRVCRARRLEGHKPRGWGAECWQRVEYYDDDDDDGDDCGEDDDVVDVVDEQEGLADYYQGCNVTWIFTANQSPMSTHT